MKLRYPTTWEDRLRRGFGDAAAAQASASALLTWLTSNACTQATVPEVSQFQTDYNSGGFSGQLTVDGQYGGNTQAALQEVLGTAAPANCFGMSVPTTPALDNAVTTPGTIPQTVVDSSATPWIIGGAALLGVGILALAYHHKHKRGR
jgi:hypothetical protein